MAASTFMRDLARVDVKTIRGQQLERTLQVVRPLVPHEPSARQREFLALDCEEACYGGAAGGGKTDCAVMAALQYVDVPDYSAVIFRRHETDFALPGSAMDLCKRWLAGNPMAVWENKLNGYRFRSGATLHFGYATTTQQLIDKYQGPYFQFIGFDELTQWPEQMYQYMFSRLRRLKHSPVPTRMRGFTNPGGRGHSWVKQRFVTHAKSTVTGSDAREDIKKFRMGLPLPEPSTYASPPSEDAKMMAREAGREAQPAYFVPAFLKDNPGLDVEGYEANLARLDPVTRAQLKNGDWDVISAGNLFKAEWFKIIPAAPIGLRTMRSWDFAATAPKPNTDPDWTAGPKQGIETLENGDKRLVITALEHFRENPGETQRRVKATAVMDGKKTSIFLEQEPGSAGKTLVHSYKANLLFGWIVHHETRTGPKEEYWKPVSALAEHGGLALVEGDWNAPLIEELTGLPTGSHDDIADAISLGFAYQTGKGSAADRTRALISR